MKPNIPENYNPDEEQVYDAEYDGDTFDANVEANRVLSDYIGALLQMSTVICSVHEGTTTCIATVYLPNGFDVATETATCLDLNNFDPEKGKQIAANRALKAAEKKLWELEGYRMMCMRMQNAYEAAAAQNRAEEAAEANAAQLELFPTDVVN